MFKILLKILILPLFFILPPILILLITLKQGTFSPSTIKKTLSRTDVYTSIEENIIKMAGGIPSQLNETKSQSSETAFVSQMITTYLPASYLKQKSETLLDNIDLWIHSNSSIEPVLSFSDLQEQLKNAHPKEINKINEILSSFSEKTKDIPSESIQTDPLAAFTFPKSIDDLVGKNLTFPLGAVLLPVKFLSQLITPLIIILSVIDLGALLFIVMISSSISSKFRWFAFSTLVAASSLYFFLTIIPQTNRLISLIFHFFPQPISSTLQPLIDTLLAKPIFIAQNLTKKGMQLLLLLSFSSFAISFLDFSFQKKSQKRNLLVVCIGASIAFTLYIGFLPYARTIPIVRQFIKSPTISIVTSTIKKSAFISKNQSSITIDDGETGFKLQVPENASLFGTSATLTPLIEINNLPQKTALLAGVHLHSQDLILQKPAILTIHSDQSLGKQIRGFMYDNEGSNFITFPVTIENNEILIPILHASGYGIITVPDNFKDQSDGSNDVRAQAQQKILHIIGTIANFQSIGNSDSLTESQIQEIQNILIDWWKRGVKPNIASALQNDEAIIPAVKEYLIWLQSVQAVGLDEKMASEVKISQSDLAKAIKKAVDTASTTCRENKDPSQVGKLLKLYAITESVAFDGIAELNVTDIKNKALGCAQFKLEISSNFIDSGSVCEGFNETYEGAVLLSPNDDFTLSGKGEIEAKSIKVCNTECRLERGDGPVKTIIEIPDTQLSVTNSQKNISLELTAPDESDNYYDCTYTVPGTDSELGLHLGFGWYGSFFNLHEDESTGWFSVQISDWIFTGGQDSYATKTYDRTKKSSFMGMGGVPVHEKTTLKLIHIPK